MAETTPTDSLAGIRVLARAKRLAWEARSPEQKTRERADLEARLAGDPNKLSPGLRTAVGYQASIRCAVAYFGFMRGPSRISSQAPVRQIAQPRRTCEGRRRPGAVRRTRRAPSRSAGGGSGDPHLGGDDPPGEPARSGADLHVVAASPSVWGAR